MSGFKFKVTEKHIRAGNKGECGSCPVALALDELFGNECDDIRVRYTYAEIGMPGATHNLRLSQETQDFIHNFDSPSRKNNRKAKPFMAEVTVE